MANILWFDEIDMAHLPEVGGKNASLGEMTAHLAPLGVSVPRGFAITATAYRKFLRDGGLDRRIYDRIADLDADNIVELRTTGAEIRNWIKQQPLPTDLMNDLRESYEVLVGTAPGVEAPTVAVRSSATAEDLPDASFAGQQESFLNISGVAALAEAVGGVFASLYNDRAIAYRVHHGFTHDIAISVGVQMMVRSDIGSSGVMFTVDTESGFDQVVLITSSYGLGEAVVQGAVNPDEFYVSKVALRQGRPALLRRTVGEKAIAMRYTHRQDTGTTTEYVDVPAWSRQKFSITDAEVHELAKQAVAIEAHYGAPMDIEWARDGRDGKLYILQARPETVVSRRATVGRTRYALNGEGPVLVEGRAVGHKIGTGKVRVMTDLDDMIAFETGDVLVADMTDPDWEPVMKSASAIVTNRGDRTCHAAIIARELGVPAVVGTTEATELLRDGEPVTVDCSQGDTGKVYSGALPFHVEESEPAALPELPVQIMMNVTERVRRDRRCCGGAHWPQRHA